MSEHEISLQKIATLPQVQALIEASRCLSRALVEDEMWAYASLAGGVLEALDAFEDGAE